MEECKLVKIELEKLRYLLSRHTAAVPLLKQFPDGLRQAVADVLSKKQQAQQAAAIANERAELEAQAAREQAHRAAVAEAAAQEAEAEASRAREEANRVKDTYYKPRQGKQSPDEKTKQRYHRRSDARPHEPAEIAKRLTMEEERDEEIDNELAALRVLYGFGKSDSENDAGPVPSERDDDEADGDVDTDEKKQRIGFVGAIVTNYFLLLKARLSRQDAMTLVSEHYDRSRRQIYNYLAYWRDNREMFTPHANREAAKHALTDVDRAGLVHAHIQSLHKEKAPVTLASITAFVNSDVIDDLVEAREGKPYSESWVRLGLLELGYKYSKVQKTILTDGHENEENRRDRQERFVPAYLELHKRMRLYSRDGKERLFDMSDIAMLREQQACREQYIADVAALGSAWHAALRVHGDGAALVAPTPSAYLQCNKYRHDIDAAQLRYFADETLFLQRNFFQRDHYSVPNGCVSESFDPLTMDVVAIVDEDEMVVQCKDFSGSTWQCKKAKVRRAYEKSKGAGVMVAGVAEIGGIGLLELSPIENAERLELEARHLEAEASAAATLAAEATQKAKHAQSTEGRNEAVNAARAATAQAVADAERARSAQAAAKRDQFAAVVADGEKRKRKQKQHFDESDTETSTTMAPPTPRSPAARRRVVDTAATDSVRQAVLAERKAHDAAKEAEERAVAARAHADVAFQGAYRGGQLPPHVPQFVKDGVFHVDPHHARADLMLEYGGQREGWFERQLVVAHARHAAAIAEFKFKGCTIYHLYDHSGAHMAKKENGLDVKQIRKKDGCASQPDIRDTTWTDSDGAKHQQKIGKSGLVTVLKARNVNVDGKNVNELRALLAEFDDFKNERGVLEEMLETLPRPQHLLRGVKYHPELMMIEQIWGVAKRRIRALLTGSYRGLPRLVLETLRSVPSECNMRFSRKVFETVVCYSENNYDALEEALKAAKRRRTGGELADPKLYVPLPPPGAVCVEVSGGDDDDDDDSDDDVDNIADNLEDDARDDNE